MYKFKSQAAADVIMLAPSGGQILDIIGKEHSPQGIVTVAQMPGAIQALEAAVEQEKAAAAAHHAQAHGLDESRFETHVEGVSLAQRAAPFIELLRRSAEEGRDVVWGV